MVQVNNSAHQAEPAVVEKPVTCNCSGEMKKLWEALSINKQTMESLKRELQALKEEKGSNGKRIQNLFDGNGYNKALVNCSSEQEDLNPFKGKFTILKI